MPSDSWNSSDADLLEAAIAEFGIPLTFGSEDPVDVVPDPDSVESTLAEHGYVSGATLVVEMRRSNFAALGLVQRAEVTVDSRLWRILRTSSDPADAGIRLTLELV